MDMKKPLSHFSANLLIGLSAALVAAFISIGCKKSTPPVAVEQVPAAAEVQPASNQAPVSHPVATTVPPAAQPAAGPDLGELNRGMIRWIVANRRRPNNFEDFAATANIVIPPPPAGKKYIIDSTMHIQLVNR